MSRWIPYQISPRHRTLIFVVAIAGVFAALAIFNPGLRVSFQHVSEQATDVPRRLILAVILLEIVQTIASTLSWRNVLRSAFPQEPITCKRVFTIQQAKDAAGLVLPSKIGTWGMLSAFRLSIPGAQMPTILAAWAAQSIGYIIFGLVNTLAAAYLLPGTFTDRPNPAKGIVEVVKGQPLLAAIVAIAVSAAVWLAVAKFRARLLPLKDQFIAGVAIVGSPARYLRLVFLPVAISYSCRYGMTIAAMSAFGIPITPTTVVIAITSHQIASAIRITPGGFGTTQAVDIITLHAFASSSTIAAYSVSQGVLKMSLTLVSGMIALLWTLNARPESRFSLARIRKN